MRALFKRLMPAIPIAALVSIGSGIWLALLLRWGNLDSFFSSNWGWAILAAFLATVAYLVVAFAVDDPAVQGLEKLWDSTEDREPTAEEARELERLGARSRMAARTEAGLMLVIVGAMAVVRFV